MKKIYVYSPQAQTGKTTIANHLAMVLSKEVLTCLVECNRYNAYSIYLNNKIKEQQKSITNVYNNLNVEQQLIQSKHSEKYFFLSKNITDELLDLYNINSEAYHRMIDYLEEHFEYIILDLPSNYIEKMLIDSISQITKEDYLIVILDENLQTYKLLKDYDAYFKSILLNISPEKVICIKNKTNGYIEEKTTKVIIDTLSVLKSCNPIIEIPYIPEIVLYNNEGKNILSGSGNKKEKKYVYGINKISDIICSKNIKSDYKMFKKEKKSFFSK